MPQPDIAPDIAASILAELQQQTDQVSSQGLAQRRFDLHAYLRNWMAMSMSNRRSNYENKWNRWRRNARNIYDPALLARKEQWQNAMFVPITMQNKEIIKSTLYRTLINELPYSVRNRPSGSLDEALNIRTLILRELELSGFEVSANDFFDDVLTYGTGFMKFYQYQKWSKRARREKQLEPLTPQVLAQMQQGYQPKVVGFKKKAPEKVLVYDGLMAEYVSIWDMFFEDNAKTIQGGSCAQRYNLNFQQIIDGIREGYFFADAYYKLKDIHESASPPIDRQEEWADLNLSVIEVPKVNNYKNHTCYEWWGLLPQKWVFVRDDDQHLITNLEELVPAKCVFTNEALLSVDPNEDYKGENPYESTGYIHYPGMIYHIGIGEMLEQLQESINEDTNQRKDNVQLILNRMFAILERSIVSRADLISRPGGAIRIKSNSADDVNKAIAWIDTPDVTRSAYEETINTERFSQQLTAANQVMAGGQGVPKSRDITSTKGGLALIKQSSNDRISYYAMVIESDFLKKVIKKAYSIIYNNITPEKLQKVLGPQKAQQFILRSPEDVENDYYFEPEGVFSTMNQPIRISQWQAFRDQFKGAPFFNDIEMAQVLAKAIELPEMDKIIVPPVDPMSGKQIPFQLMQQLSIIAQAQSGNFQPPHGEGKAGEKGTKPKLPSSKAGKNEPIQT